MKNIVVLLFLFTITFFNFAQEQENNMQFGFGVSIAREVPTFTSEELEVIALPIDLANFSMIIKGKNFRIEPSLGYFTGSSEYSNGQYKYESSTSNFRIGAVIAYNNSSFESMNFYYGIDIGIILSSYSYSSSMSSESSDGSKTDFFVGPAIGGEYLFNRYFSLGGEINLNYISIGNYGDSDGDSSTWMISTRGAVYVRWYVN